MVDILPQRWAGSQGSADAAIARVWRDCPVCNLRSGNIQSAKFPEPLIHSTFHFATLYFPTYYFALR